VSKIACFVEKYNFTDPREEGALRNFKLAAEKRGIEFNFLFREDISNVPNYDAVFIRATTDPKWHGNWV
jgi:glutathione synthase/RimK-type ligase-like ATP-grasp enzyme